MKKVTPFGVAMTFAGSMIGAGFAPGRNSCNFSAVSVQTALLVFLYPPCYTLFKVS